MTTTITIAHKGPGRRTVKLVERREWYENGSPQTATKDIVIREGESVDLLVYDTTTVTVFEWREATEDQW